MKISCDTKEDFFKLGSTEMFSSIELFIVSSIQIYNCCQKQTILIAQLTFCPFLFIHLCNLIDTNFQLSIISTTDVTENQYLSSVSKNSPNQLFYC